MVETSEEAKEAAAGATAAQEQLEKKKKIVPVIQAKTRVKAAKTKVKSATIQIRISLEDFIELRDASPRDKEAAALTIQASWKRLMSGTVELQDATDNLANVLSSADRIAIEEDPDKIIKEN